MGGDGTRLIFHLSYDFKKENLKSVNFFTPKEKCSVQYRDLDFAVRTFLNLTRQDVNEPETDAQRTMLIERKKLGMKWRSKFTHHKRMTDKVIYSGKSDLQSAFCILGLLPSCWAWLVMMAKNPLTGEWCYFVDKCLPFGSSRSCALFQQFSDALCFLTEAKLKVQKRITNYLDDFLFIALQLLVCNNMIKGFLRLCDQLGILVSLEKTGVGK